MDIEVRIGCSAYPSARRVGLQVLRRHLGVAKGASDWSSAGRPCPQVLQRHHVVAKGASGRSLARPPCPQLPQRHPGVAKSHLTKDKPVSARCKDQLSYCRAYRQTYRMVSYVGLTDRQTGLPYRQPYLKLSPAGSHGSSLPDGFIRQTYRQVSFQRPDRPALPTALPARPTNSLTGQTDQQPYRQPHRPASPASHTSQPDRPAQPASPTSHPHQPARPAIHPGKGPAGLPYR